MTEEQTNELAKEACWTIGDCECDGNCRKCNVGHWKHYKFLVKEIVKKWESIKNTSKN